MYIIISMCDFPAITYQGVFATARSLLPQRKQTALRVITHADVVTEVGRLSARYVCVYVSTLKQKPLDVSSPNLADG